MAAVDRPESFRLAYLDPPYNTRTSGRLNYRDHRTDGEWDALVRDVASGCRNIMRSDGSLWFRTNDRQLGRARSVLDAVFDPGNYIGTVVWERTRRPAFTSRHLVSTLDPILIYAKDANQLRPFVRGTTEKGKRVPLAHRGNRIQDLIFPSGSVRFGVPDALYESGDHSTPSIFAELTADLIVKNGTNFTALCLRLPSRYSAAKVLEMAVSGADFSVPKTPFRPSYIATGGKPKAVSSLWSWQLDPGMPTHEDAYKEQLQIGIGAPFQWAKPEGLVRRIIELATDPGDLVLDPFAGSGTTAAAAIQTRRGFLVIEEQLDLIERYVNRRVSDAWAHRDRNY